MFDSDSMKEYVPMQAKDEIIDFTEHTAATEKLSQPEETDDALLVEIDAFRDKAKQLQGLINAKQDRVNVLEKLVADKEVQNNKLQEELKKRKRQADGLLADVESQMNRMQDSVMHNMDSMEERIRAQVAQISETQTSGGVPAELDVSALKETFDGQAKEIRSIFDEQQEKMDASFAKQQEELKTSFEEQQKKMDASIATLSQSNGDTDKIVNGISDMRRDISDMQNNISDKIHAEDVKVYRNLQDYIKEQDKSEENAAFMTKKFKSLRLFSVFNIILTIVNIAICIFFLLIIL